jgi:hypothetical protein
MVVRNSKELTPTVDLIRGRANAMFNIINALRGIRVLRHVTESLVRWEPTGRASCNAEVPKSCALTSEKNLITDKQSMNATERQNVAPPSGLRG